MTRLLLLLALIALAWFLPDILRAARLRLIDYAVRIGRFSPEQGNTLR